MCISSFTYLGPPHEFPCERLGALLQGVEDEGERAGGISEVEQLLKQQQTVSPLVRLCRGRHGLGLGCVIA